MAKYCRRGSTPVSTVLRKSVRFFIIDILSCKASSEEKELAKLSCMNDSETQERGLWEVKIEKNVPLGHAPGPPKSLRLRRSFRKSVSINPRSAPVLDKMLDKKRTKDHKISDKKKGQEFALKIGQKIEQEMRPVNRTRNRTKDQT